MVDLKDRTLDFAVDVRKFARSIKMDRLNQDDIAQLIRASGSVGANFGEAIESISKRDFIYRLKICLKEARESRYWLIVIEKTNSALSGEQLSLLIQESKELIMIFSSIIQKHKRNK